MSNKAYTVIQSAIEYCLANFKSQPSLDELAAHVNLSPHHFQRLFTEWAGVSPKKFIKFLTIEHAKKLLLNSQHSVLNTALDSGLSGSGRLHDLFISLEAMSPGEYKKGGNSLVIDYQYYDSIFGSLIIASTHIGICHLQFSHNNEDALNELIDAFPNAQFNRHSSEQHRQAVHFFTTPDRHINQFKLHLKGSAFQLKVWQALLNVPYGHLLSYRDIAKIITSPQSSLAVGSAIGKNPVAYLIPCHRIIQSNGHFGQYRWGDSRKAVMIAREAVNL